MHLPVLLHDVVKSEIVPDTFFAPWVGTTSARWSKPRPNASPASGPHIARLTQIQTTVSEPDPVLAFFPIPVLRP